MEVVIYILFGIGIIFLYFFGNSQTKYKKRKKKKYKQYEVREDSPPYVLQEPEGGYKYKPCKYLMTKNESKLFQALKKVFPNDHYIHCQTSLAAILEPDHYEKETKKQALRNIWAKRIDFVVTDAYNKIVVAIELDDFTHKRPDRIERDKFVNNAFKNNHPFIRINTQDFYKPEEITALLHKHISPEDSHNYLGNNEKPLKKQFGET